MCCETGATDTSNGKRVLKEVELGEQVFVGGDAVGASVIPVGCYRLEGRR